LKREKVQFGCLKVNSYNMSFITVNGKKIAFNDKKLWLIVNNYDAASLALFARMDAVGETPDGTRKDLLNTAIIAAKAANIWSGMMDTQWLLASHGEESSKLNIIQNAFNITEVGTPIHTIDRGWTGNGTDTGLCTNFQLLSHGVKYTQNAATVGIYIRNNLQALQVFSAEHTALHGVAFVPRYADDNRYFLINGGYLTNACVDSRGMWYLRRVDATNIGLYRNTTNLGTWASTSESLVDEVMYLLMRNVAGVFSGWSAYEISLAFVGGLMSVTDITNFQTIWVDGYLNSIGAKV
jgi:hypothetical protein